MTRYKVGVGVAVAALAMAVGALHGAEDRALLYAAAIEQVGRATGCKKKARCCYSIEGAVPAPEIVKLVSAAGLEPVPQSGACSMMTLDARRARGDNAAYEYVQVSASVGGSGVSGCTYAFRKKSKRWQVEPSETRCPLVE